MPSEWNRSYLHTRSRSIAILQKGRRRRLSPVSAQRSVTGQVVRCGRSKTAKYLGSVRASKSLSSNDDDGSKIAADGESVNAPLSNQPPLCHSSFTQLRMVTERLPFPACSGVNCELWREESRGEVEGGASAKLPTSAVPALANILITCFYRGRARPSQVEVK